MDFKEGPLIFENFFCSGISKEPTTQWRHPVMSTLVRNVPVLRSLEMALQFSFRAPTCSGTLKRGRCSCTRGQVPLSKGLAGAVWCYRNSCCWRVEEPLMLIRKSPAVRSNEITDEQWYLRRREFMRIAGGAAIAAAAAPLLTGCSGDAVSAEPGGVGLYGAAQNPLSGYKPRAIATDEKLNSFEEITGYNNFFEFGTGKSDPQRYAGRLKTSPWTVKIDGLCAKPADYHRRGSHQAAGARGTHLPVALRRGVVDGHPVDRGAAGRRDQARGADVKGDVRRVHHADASVRDAGSADGEPRVAVHGGASYGRGDAPADDSRGRHVRQDPHESAGRADSARGPLEVRVQERQVHRADPLRRQAAANGLAAGEP